MVDYIDNILAFIEFTVYWEIVTIPILYVKCYERESTQAAIRAHKETLNLDMSS